MPGLPAERASYLVFVFDGSSFLGGSSSSSSSSSGAVQQQIL